MKNIFVLVTILGHLPVILSAKRKGSDNMKHILIVEDDNLLNKTLTYNLELDGYTITSVLNARTAAANYAQTECQFRYCGTAIPFLTVRSTAR